MVEEDSSAKLSDNAFRMLLGKCHLSNLPRKGERMEPDEILTSDMVGDPSAKVQKLLAMNVRLRGLGGAAETLIRWAEGGDVFSL